MGDYVAWCVKPVSSHPGLSGAPALPISAARLKRWRRWNQRVFQNSLETCSFETRHRGEEREVGLRDSASRILNCVQLYHGYQIHASDQ